jgi:hypothetical protein
MNAQNNLATVSSREDNEDSARLDRRAELDGGSLALDDNIVLAGNIIDLGLRTLHKKMTRETNGLLDTNGALARTERDSLGGGSSGLGGNLGVLVLVHTLELVQGRSAVSLDASGKCKVA